MSKNIKLQFGQKPKLKEGADAFIKGGNDDGIHPPQTSSSEPSAATPQRVKKESTAVQAQKRFPLILPEWLFKKIKHLAVDEDIPMNEYILNVLMNDAVLAKGQPTSDIVPDAGAAKERAA